MRRSGGVSRAFSLDALRASGPSASSVRLPRRTTVSWMPRTITVARLRWVSSIGRVPAHPDRQTIRSCQAPFRNPRSPRSERHSDHPAGGHCAYLERGSVLLMWAERNRPLRGVSCN
jgi:hypothetical protein